jgi:hypothetical protein
MDFDYLFGIFKLGSHPQSCSVRPHVTDRKSLLDGIAK